MSRSKVSERGTDASDQENVLPEVWKQSMEEGEAGEGGAQAHVKGEEIHLFSLTHPHSSICMLAFIPSYYLLCNYQ